MKPLSLQQISTIRLKPFNMNVAEADTFVLNPSVNLIT